MRASCGPSIVLQKAHALVEMLGLPDAPELCLAIFESVWKDRAQAAGWNLELSCGPSGCTMHFTR